MTLVAGVDSSTQSCKVVVVDADTGEIVREGKAAHPDGTAVDPAAWWEALANAADEAGGVEDVSALAVGAQQHGMVCLSERGDVVRDALLWNDTRSANAAADLIQELGGKPEWAAAVGVVPVASFTVTKLRWFAEAEPDIATRAAAVALPHDWLTWRLAASDDVAVHTLDHLTTDRSDASGTGYWSPATGEYRRDLLRLAFGRDLVVPRVLGPSEQAGEYFGVRIGPGAGDNAAAALALDARPGDLVLSIGTSGVACAVSPTPTTDASGAVAGFADATGHYLPLVATLNAARVLDATARLLGVSLDALADLALAAPPGADGLVVVPYLEGERTPDKPFSTGAVHGLTLSNSTPSHLARAAFEGMLCGLADAVDAIEAVGSPVRRIMLVGGGAKSPAVQQIAAAILGRPVAVPPPGEYVALGAARQAAWTLTGWLSEWHAPLGSTFRADATPYVRDRYAEARELTIDR